MNMTDAIAKLALILGSVLATVALAADVGQPAPAFTLTGTDGEEHSLSEYRGKIVVLEWTNYGCPFVRKHYGTGNMQRLQRDYTGRGVVWLTVCSSGPGKQGHFSAAEWQRKLAENGAAATATLLDPEGTVGKAYGARTTPHMFVIDAGGTLVYAGAIDDQTSWDPKSVTGATNYVAEVLDALLAGAAVEPKTTRPYGCGVKYAR